MLQLDAWGSMHRSDRHYSSARFESFKWPRVFRVHTEPRRAPPQGCSWRNRRPTEVQPPVTEQHNMCNGNTVQCWGDSCRGKMSLRTRYAQMPACIQTMRCRNPCTKIGINIVMSRVCDVSPDPPHPWTACGRPSRLDRGLNCTGWTRGSTGRATRMGIHSILVQIRGLVKQLVRCVIRTFQALVMSPVTVPLVATWLVLQTDMTQACASTVQPAMNLASATAVSPSILEEFNSWALYKMQKVRMSIGIGLICQACGIRCMLTRISFSPEFLIA